MTARNFCRTYRITALFVFCPLLLAGCLAPIKAQSCDDPLAGKWKGQWIDLTHNHKGPLRCTMTRLDDTTYQAKFSGTYGWLIPFWYTVQMRVQQEGNIWKLTTEHNLGKVHGGVFTCEGTASGDQMEFTYTASGQNGTFSLKRR